MPDDLGVSRPFAPVFFCFCGAPPRGSFVPARRMFSGWPRAGALWAGSGKVSLELVAFDGRIGGAGYGSLGRDPFTRCQAVGSHTGALGSGGGKFSPREGDTLAYLLGGIGFGMPSKCLGSGIFPLASFPSFSMEAEASCNGACPFPSNRGDALLGMGRSVGLGCVVELGRSGVLAFARVVDRGELGPSN